MERDALFRRRRWWWRRRRWRWRWRWRRRWWRRRWWRRRWWRRRWWWRWRRRWWWRWRRWWRRWRRWRRRSGAVRGRPDLTRRAGRRWLLRLLGFGHHRGLRLYPCSAASAAPAAAVGQDKHRRKQNGANRGSIQRKRGADAAPALKSSAHPGPVTVLFPSCNHHVAFRSIRPLPSVVVSLDFV